MKIFILFLFVLCSCTQQAPRQPVVVQAPVSVVSKVSNDSSLVIALEKNKAFYLDGLNGNTAVKTEIKPYTTNHIIQVLDSIEQRHNISLADHEKYLLVRGDPDIPYTSFMILKNALKEKKITKFRIVTTGN